MNSETSVVPSAVVAPQPVPPAKPAEVLASINDLKKFRIVTAKVLEAAVHPNADKLYVLKVDSGDGVRQVVAGIKRSYTPEQLVGKSIILIANLEPAVIRGVESQGMILAASDDQGVSVLMADREIAPGCTVK